MNQKYIPCILETVVQQTAQQFPGVVLVCPRQSGKTTLLQHIFGEQYQVVSLPS